MNDEKNGRPTNLNKPGSLAEFVTHANESFLLGKPWHLRAALLPLAPSLPDEK